MAPQMTPYFSLSTRKDVTKKGQALVESVVVDSEKCGVIYGVIYGAIYPTLYNTNQFVQMHVCPGQVCPSLGGCYFQGAPSRSSSTSRSHCNLPGGANMAKPLVTHQDLRLWNSSSCIRCTFLWSWECCWHHPPTCIWGRMTVGEPTASNCCMQLIGVIRKRK